MRFVAYIIYFCRILLTIKNFDWRDPQEKYLLVTTFNQKIWLELHCRDKRY